MKKLSLIILVIIVLAVVIFLIKPTTMTPQNDAMESEQDFLEIENISHATAVFTWADTVIYLDPIGGAEAFASSPDADIVLVTDIHGDHYNHETLLAVVKEGTQLIVPQVVADDLDLVLGDGAIIMANGDSTEIAGFIIEALPMYNLPESEDAYHVKGRGNGYLLSRDGKQVYIAGDTADIPEMRALTNIDIAFIPMNLPYTMTAESAADGVLAFAPKQVYPYHYREPEGFGDVALFKQLVEAGNPEIEVVQLDWYAN